MTEHHIYDTDATARDARSVTGRHSPAEGPDNKLSPETAAAAIIMMSDVAGERDKWRQKSRRQKRAYRDLQRAYNENLRLSADDEAYIATQAELLAALREELGRQWPYRFRNWRALRGLARIRRRLAKQHQMTEHELQVACLEFGTEKEGKL